MQSYLDHYQTLRSVYLLKCNKHRILKKYLKITKVDFLYRRLGCLAKWLRACTEKFKSLQICLELKLF